MYYFNKFYCSECINYFYYFYNDIIDLFQEKKYTEQKKTVYDGIIITVLYNELYLKILIYPMV